MSRSIGIVLIVLLLTALAAAENRMSGYLTQLDTSSISIRARFRPRVPFTITQATPFYCGHEQVSSSLLRMGDAVVVKFRTQKHEWFADEVRIPAGKRACSVRVASHGPSLEVLTLWLPRVSSRERGDSLMASWPKYGYCCKQAFTPTIRLGGVGLRGCWCNDDVSTDLEEVVFIRGYVAYDRLVRAPRPTRDRR
jgi:hypothetical protein